MDLAIDQMPVSVIWKIPFHQTFEVTSMDLAIYQLDIGHKLCMANLFPPDLGGFEHRFGHNLGTRSSTGIVHFTLPVMQLIS